MSVSLKAVDTVTTTEWDMFDDVRAKFKARLRDGKALICPCCDTHAMIAKHKVTPTMAHQLTMLGNNGPMTHHELQLGNNGRWRLYSLLRFWGLVGKNEMGEWYLTDCGRQFVAGKVRIPKHVFIYDNKAIGFSDEQRTFSECYEEFRLEEVFSATGTEIKHAIHANGGRP